MPEPTPNNPKADRTRRALPPGPPGELGGNDDSLDALKTRKIKSTMPWSGLGRKNDGTGTVVIANGGAGLDELEESFCEFLLDLSNYKAPRDYRVVRRVGSGSQGVVLEVVHVGYLNCVTRYAVKVFEPNIFPTRRAYEDDLIRIARQVSILQQIYHPNLVQCEGFSHYNGVGVLEMELVDGINVRSMLDPARHRVLQERVSSEAWKRFNDVIFAHDRQCVQPGVAFYILRKVLRGLEVLHNVGYIHCDIKPSNIMIDRYGTVKLIDYGRAVAIDEPLDFFLGSPLYMAPEVHRRECMTPLSDLYSAGMVTLEMLYGDHVISPAAEEEEILAQKITLPDRLGDFLPKNVRENLAVEEILRRMLAVNPADRFHNAIEADGAYGGALQVHRQLAQAQLDADYGRELQYYLESRLPPPRNRRPSVF